LVSEVVSEDLGFVGPAWFQVVWTVASSVDLTDWGHLLRAWTNVPVGTSTAVPVADSDGWLTRGMVGIATATWPACA